jgi:hypothetical protein
MTFFTVSEFLELRKCAVCVVICGTIAGVFGGPATTRAQHASSVGSETFSTSGGARVVATSAPGESERLALGTLQGRSAAQGPARMRVRLFDSVGLPDHIRVALGREVEGIWSAAGVQVDARRPRLDEWTPDHDAPTLYVLLRDRMPLPDTDACRVHDGRPAGSAKASPEYATCMHSEATEPRAAALHGPISLAWTPFTGETSGRVVFVSVSRVRQLLSAFSYMGRRFDRCSLRLMDALLARALGRVVAHEIGHVLYGPTHTRSGLMKPMLDDLDLLGEKPPVVAGLSIQTSLTTLPF